MDIIIAFPKLENGKSLGRILLRYGMPVNAVVQTGAAAISLANELEGGIVICGYRLPDMHYRELWEYLPREFEMLLVASPSKVAEMPEGSFFLSMPIKVNDFLETVEMMSLRHGRRKAREERREKAGKGHARKERSKEEEVLIANAKTLLMDRNGLSEEEAHRYLQKSSMDSGRTLLETACLILGEEAH